MVSQEPITHCYPLILSFRDTLGNDLINCIEPEYCDNGKPYGAIINEDIFKHRFRFGSHYRTVSGVQISKVSDYYYLGFESYLTDPNINDLGVMPEKVFFEITSMHIFGDYVPREIITYWEPEGKVADKGRSFYHECYRVEFNGEVFPAEKIGQELYTPYCATIILDR
jgi:hypothetical protein